MCIAVYKPAGKQIFKRILKNCWNFNDDGAGFMWSHDGFLHYEKGYFSFRSFYRNYRRTENEYPESDFVLHFRIATSGGSGVADCHPFWIKNGVAMVHNGIFTNWSFANTKESDTALFCKSVLAKLPKGFLFNKAILELIEQYCKQELSKLIIMDGDGTIRIINEKAGIWDKGIWFSNGSYDDNYSNYVYNVASCTNSAVTSGFVNIYGKSYNFKCHICQGWFDHSEVTFEKVGLVDKWVCVGCKHIRAIECKF